MFLELDFSLVHVITIMIILLLKKMKGKEKKLQISKQKSKFVPIFFDFVFLNSNLRKPSELS